MLLVREDKSSKYPPRTFHNATTSDLTVALAVDFESHGEKLTKRAAGDKYLAIPLDVEPIAAARMLYRALTSRQARVLNVAGNGIYTIAPHGWTQERLNLHVYTMLAKIHEHWPLQRVISGGQTGVDLAGVTAAHALGIDAIATLPKGFLQRGLNNKDFTQSMASVIEQIETGAAALRNQT